VTYPQYKEMVKMLRFILHATEEIAHTSSPQLFCSNGLAEAQQACLVVSNIP